MYTEDPPAAAVMACEDRGGELISSCPTTDLVASCTPGKCETITYFYGSFTVDPYGHDLAFREASCRERGGTWTTY